MLVEPVNPHDPESVRRTIDRLSGGKIEQRASELDSVVTSGVELKIASVAADVATISNTLSAVSDLAGANSVACSSLQTDIAIISDTLSAVSDLAAGVGAISDTLSAVSDLAEANSVACSSLQTDIATISNALSAVSDLAEANSNAASSISNLAQANSAAINSIESTLSSVIASVETVLSQATSEVKTSAASELVSVAKVLSDTISNAHSLAMAVDSNGVFVDRGDPSAFDFTVGDFTIDNAWHDLDLGDIVPVGATAVLLGVLCQKDTVGAGFRLRKNGNVGDYYNVFNIRTQVANQSNTGDAIVACDANRIIEYRVSSGVWTTLNTIVRGWWIGNIFVDRGDPSAFDFTVGDFTTDGTWRDLDLSGVVPAGAVAILLGVTVKDDVINRSFSLRKNGNIDIANVFDARTQVANQFNTGDAIVVCDANRIIEYRATNTTWTTLNIIVRGWWIGGTFMDRGDPVDDDVETGDFTTDGTWRDLDLSGVVPAGAVAVALKVQVKDNIIGSELRLRKNSNSEQYNRAVIKTLVANQSFIVDVTVACDYNRVIEYWATNMSFSIIGITVKGWWGEPATISHLHSTALSLATVVDSAISDVVATAVTDTASLATAIASVESTLSSVIVSTAASLVGHFDSAITSTAKVLSDATSIVQSGLTLETTVRLAGVTAAHVRINSVETIASDTKASCTANTTEIDAVSDALSGAISDIAGLGVMVSDQLVSLHAYESALSDATSEVKTSAVSELASMAKVLSDVTSQTKASAYVDFQTNSNLISNLSNTLSALSVGEIDAISDMASTTSVMQSSLITDIATISNTLSAVSDLAEANSVAIASVESTLSSVITSTAASLIGHFDSAVASTETTLSQATSDARSLASAGGGAGDVTESHLNSTALSLATMVDSAISDVVAQAVTDTASLATAIATISDTLSAVSDLVVTRCDSIETIASDAYSLATVAPVGATTQTVNLLAADNTAAKQAKIDAIPRYIPFGVVVTFQFETGQTHTETTQLDWIGFYGGGTIYIQGNTAEANATVLHTTQDTILDFTTNPVNGLWIQVCSCYIQIKNLKIEVDDAVVFGIIAFSNVRVDTYYNYILSSGTGNAYGILNTATSFVSVQSNYVSNLKYGIASRYTNMFSSNNDDTGVLPAYGLRAYDAATIGKSGTQPAGSTAAEITSGGGVIR